MPEQDSKCDQICREVKRRAKDEIRNGKFTVEFIVHEGNIVGAEMMPQYTKIKLG